MAGVLSAEGAAEIGLEPGITMVNCGPDAYIATVGSDAFSIGDFALITGSSNVHMAPLEKRVSLPGMWGPWHDLVIRDQWTLEGGQLSTGSMLRWFVNQFALDLRSKADTNLYQVMDAQAAKIHPGSDGLVILDYWRGNRTPYNDAEATGVIWGLTLNHSREHIYRAILESVAYGTAHTLKEFSQIGLEFDLLVACGGGTNSDLWMQIYADVCGLPVRTVQFSGAPALGAAISSAVAAGQFNDAAEAAQRMVKSSNIFDPRPENTSLYGEYLQQYIETYPALKDHMHTLSQFVNTQSGKE
jgi:ribulose kinase